VTGQSIKEQMMTQIKTPFGRHSTAAEVVKGIDLSGKRAIVTGAASGIGQRHVGSIQTPPAD
jgi:hypothetical protein